LDAKRIERSIAEIERRSSAEVVVCWLPRADEYAFTRACYSLALTLILTWLLIVRFPLWPLSFLIALEGPLWALFYRILGSSVLLRLLVSERQKTQALFNRTQQLFIERGVTETRQRSGVLIVIAEAERKVRLLADRGIHQQMGDDGWREQLAPLLLSMRQGRYADGVVQLLTRLGDVLALHFPVAADDVNELPDAVFRGR
jgi:putative membrane protein